MPDAPHDPKLDVVSDMAGTVSPNRYPGTLPFTDSALDRIRFRGREEEVHALLHQLLGAGLLVFFAKPGLGKTSLLNARLFDLLRQHDFLPLPVRFNQPNLAPPVTPIFLPAFEQRCHLEGIDYTAGQDHSLWEFFKTAVFWRGDRLQIPVLVLDQFEEIFELTPQFRRALAAELGQLTSGRLPDELRQQAQAKEELPFSEKPPDVKILISLREDELGLLEELTSEIPGILQNRFRLTGLSNEDARRAIVEPAMIEPEEIQFATRPFAYQEEAIEQIIAAATTFEGTIDPFFLQLLCSNVEKQIRQRQRANGAAIEVDTGYLGGEKGVKALTAEFYHNAIRALPDRGLQKRARRMCEEELVTVDGRRRSVPLDDLKHNFKVTDQSLELLENARLLRSEPKLGTSYYEVSHDRLAEAIRDSRAWRMPLKGWIAVSAVGMVIITLLVIAGIISYQQHVRAESEYKLRLASEEARDQAENFVNFLIFDLRDKLTPIGRFDVLEDIQKYVESYYEKMGVEGVSDDVMRRREVVFNNGGNLRRNRGDLKAALESYRKGMEIGARLAGNYPSNAELQRDLFVSYNKIGDVQSAQGDLKAALEAYRKGMEISARLAGNDPSNTEWQRDLSISYDGIGDVQSAQGDLKAALEAYRKGMEISARLAGNDPSNTEWQRDLSISYDRIGDVQRAQGDLKAALEAYHKGMEISARLAGNDPSNTDWQRDLSISYDRIGNVQSAQGDLKAALEAYHKGMEIRARLAGNDPSNTDWQRGLSISYNKIGYMQSAQGDLKAALEAYHKGMEISAKLAGNDPSNTEWQRDLSFIYDRIGDVERAQGDLEGARGAYRKALEILTKLTALDAENTTWKVDLAYSHWEMAYLLGTLPNPDKQQSGSACKSALEILRPLAGEDRLGAEEAGWVREIETLLSSLTAPQKTPNKPPNRNP